MEPSTHRMAFDADADPVLSQVEAELNQQCGIPIRMRRVLVFEADTAEFMLRARVYDALMTACGHDTWRRLFQALD